MAKLQTFDLGYGGLLRGIERGQDKADRKREKEEDRIFEAEQRQLDREAQISQIKEKGAQTRQNIEFQGDVDINKIKTSQEFDALMQKRKEEFLAGESDKDRQFKGTQLDKQIAASKEEWMAKLESTENLFERGNAFQREIEKFKQDGNMEALKTRLAATASENSLDREAQQILQSDRLDASAKIAQLDRLSRESINNKNIIAEAVQREKDRLLKKDLSKADIDARLANLQKRYELELKGYKERGILDREQARIIKQQEADKTYSFDPQFLQGLKKEKGGIFGAGFNETDVLSAFRGDPEDPNKPDMFVGLANNVRQVMQTSPDNPQRQEVLNALIEVQDQFQDPRFYGSKDKFTGESNEAFANVKAVQNLMMLMGPQGQQAIKVFDPNAQSDPTFGPVVPAVKAVGSAAAEGMQDILNSLIQNYQQTNQDPTIYPDIGS
jgi:hypothetical protein